MNWEQQISHVISSRQPSSLAGTFATRNHQHKYSHAQLREGWVETQTGGTAPLLSPPSPLPNQHRSQNCSAELWTVGWRPRVRQRELCLNPFSRRSSTARSQMCSILWSRKYFRATSTEGNSCILKLEKLGFCCTPCRSSPPPQNSIPINTGETTPPSPQSVISQQQQVPPTNLPYLQAHVLCLIGAISWSVHIHTSG